MNAPLATRSGLVRSARKEISGQVTREIKRHNNDTFHQLTQDPALMDVHIRAQRDYEALTDQEKVTWGLWMFTWISQTEDGYLARLGGIPGMTWVDRYLLGVASALRTPQWCCYLGEASSLF